MKKHWGIREAQIANGLKDPFIAFSQHKRAAKRRGIDFKMTFQEWWSVWENDYKDRGVGSGKKCMCRTRDEGGYEIGNVRIDSHRGNLQEYTVGYRSRKAYRLGASNCRGTGAAFNPSHGSASNWIVERFSQSEDVDYGALDIDD